MNKNLEFRSGTIADVKQLKALSLASYGQYAHVLTPENWLKLETALQDEDALLELIKKSHTFVCEHDDKIVGMAFLITSGNQTDIFESEWSYIRMVGVHPDYSRRGIARKLTELCIEKSKDLNEKFIALHTSEFMDAARHLYESLGFKQIREIPDRLGKKYWLYLLHLS